MSAAYDAIAAIYDADMGVSMTLPDIRYYAELAQAAGGPVLELGCGTGRVLGGLREAGIDAYGVDRSGGMLAQARARLGPQVPLMRMDMRQLALRAHFALVLLPYSLPTYLNEDQDWADLAAGLRLALAPQGQVLLDAFIPRPVAANGRWTRDYARQVNGHWLVRHKRIQPLAADRNRIERRYRLRGVFNGRTLHTCEEIRTYTPEQLVAVTERHIGPVRRVDYDYGSAAHKNEARFCSVLAQIQR